MIFSTALGAKRVFLILLRTQKNLTHRHLNLNSCKNCQELIENNWHCEDIVDYNIIQRDDEDNDDANGLIGETHYQAGGILTYSTGRWGEIMPRMRKPSFVGGKYSKNAFHRCRLPGSSNSDKESRRWRIHNITIGFTNIKIVPRFHYCYSSKLV